VHLHYDLIFLVRRVGGSLRSGRWFTAEEIENLETYENVKNVLRLALRAAGSP